MTEHTQRTQQILEDGQPVTEEELKDLVGKLMDEQEFGVALEMLAKAKKQDPDNLWILQKLALCTARQIIKGVLPVPDERELKDLIGKLKDNLEFGLARKVLSKAKEQAPNKPWIVQKLALCTYKDPDLPPSTRFDEALTLLEGIGLRDPDVTLGRKKIDPKTLPETLGLGGAVYKRKWEYGGQLEHLHQALVFYRSAWERDKKTDAGYGGVNAAYVLDLLASRAKTTALRSGVKLEDSEEASQLLEEAQHLREDMLTVLPELADKDPELNTKYWYLVTVAEIHFGLGNWKEAGKWLARAHEVRADEWERETTFKQLVSIARLHGCTLPEEGSNVEDWQEAWQGLHEFLKEDTEAAMSCYRGKVGLALSGGGFRASFFHLGVLARLAEMDALRTVDVLSTVSGGSIVGAHYYLEVQKLLRKQKDLEIGSDHYIAIVRRVQEHFLAGVQRNLRTRTLARLGANLKMLFLKEYSMSHRLGELYEEQLYSQIGEENHQRKEPRTMPELMIRPAHWPKNKNFKPRFSNWRRRAKVPVLLLNATSLNSGHNWHFTASWMGEPPGSVSTDVDVNERYRRLWYRQAFKPAHKNYRLGYAVAASACVPGLFEPLVLEGLYPGRTVRLVDGGVHDNQGVEGLLDEGCTLALCSDASGQMDDQRRPSDSVIGVPLRSNSILMDRVREAQYQNLRSRVESGALQGLFFIHLKQGLETSPIDWTKCQDPTIPPLQSVCTTDYGVDMDLQRKLAAIRTDLDSFSEVEAYSLMLSGYLMTEHEFKELNKQHKRDKNSGDWGGFDIDAGRGAWPFLELKNLIREPPESSDARRSELGRQLDVGSSSLFKIWKLSPALRWTSRVAGLALLVLLVWLIESHWEAEWVLPTIPVKGLTVSVLLLVAGAILPVLKWLNPQRAIRNYWLEVAIAVGGFFISHLHLWTFDWMYIKRGKLKRLLLLR